MPGTTTKWQIPYALGTDVINTLDETDLSQVTRLEQIFDILIPIGFMAEYAGAGDPNTTWLLCDGRELSRTTYAALYAALGGAGSPYGQGNGSTTFNIPDYRGRVSVMEDGTAGRLTANDARGQSGGAEKHTLTIGEMPSHTHTYQGVITQVLVSGNAANGVRDPQPGQTTGSTGGGGAHNNMQPYLVANRIIRVQ